MKIFKYTSFLFLFIIACFHATWIQRCENLWMPGRTYDERTTRQCQLIWDHQTYEAKQYLQNR